MPKFAPIGLDLPITREGHDRIGGLRRYLCSTDRGTMTASLGNNATLCLERSQSDLMDGAAPTSDATKGKPEAGSQSPEAVKPNATPKKHGQKQTKASDSLTPAMRQYLAQKKQVGEAILLFRMGDFYETFFEDAKTIARELGLTLTARNKNSATPIPLAGVPYHAVDGYIAKLVKATFKVALSE